jgi:hypothetical protein
MSAEERSKACYMVSAVVSKYTPRDFISLTGISVEDTSPEIRVILTTVIFVYDIFGYIYFVQSGQMSSGVDEISIGSIHKPNRVPRS